MDKIIDTLPLRGPGTRSAELQRTAEFLVELAERHEGDPLRATMEILFILRSTNRTTEKDLQDLQEILDAQHTRRKLAS